MSEFAGYALVLLVGIVAGYSLGRATALSDREAIMLYATETLRNYTPVRKAWLDVTQGRIKIRQGPGVMPVASTENSFEACQRESLKKLAHVLEIAEQRQKEIDARYSNTRKEVE